MSHYSTKGALNIVLGLILTVVEDLYTSISIVVPHPKPDLDEAQCVAR